MKSKSETTMSQDDRKQMLLTSVPVIVLIILIVFFEIVSKGRLLSAMNIDALLNSMFSIALGALVYLFSWHREIWIFLWEEL